MKREQVISQEDPALASDTAQSPTNEPVESASRRFQPPANLFKRLIRRPEFRKIVPLADTTIYEMEQRGEFPKRFFLTPRCVVWDLAEVGAWLDGRRRASETDALRQSTSAGSSSTPHPTGQAPKSAWMNGTTFSCRWFERSGRPD